MRHKTTTWRREASALAERKSHSPIPEKIREHAHEIYVARGGVDGMGLDDWLKAEQELSRKIQG
jgi:hypothetical protein